eukprot:9852116-Alexandrium_andersonii.AAC.1
MFRGEHANTLQYGFRRVGRPRRTWCEEVAWSKLFQVQVEGTEGLDPAYKEHDAMYRNIMLNAAK